jgi:hypothetical protein
MVVPILLYVPENSIKMNKIISNIQAAEMKLLRSAVKRIRIAKGVLPEKLIVAQLANKFLVF